MTDSPRDVEEHLRAASDAILLLVAEVEQLEEHKRGVSPADRRFDELAASVRAVAQALAEFTEQEEAWARDAVQSVAGISTIDESSNAPNLAAILDRWRAIERQLDDAAPGSEESVRLFGEFQRARDEYLAAFQARHPRT